MLALRNNNLANIFDEFDNFWGQTPASLTKTMSKTPAVNVYEEDDAFVVEAELPGVSEKNVDLQFEDNTLKLAVKRAEKKEEKDGKRYYMREFSSSAYSRSIRFNAAVDQSKAEAKFNSGILTVTLPKDEKAKARKIKIDA